MKRSNVLSKYKGLTFAEAASKIESKYPNRDIDTVAANSFETEMKELAKANELAKIKEQVTQYKSNPQQEQNIQGALSLNLDNVPFAHLSGLNPPLNDLPETSWSDNLVSNLDQTPKVPNRLSNKPMPYLSENIDLKRLSLNLNNVPFRDISLSHYDSDGTSKEYTKPEEKLSISDRLKNAGKKLGYYYKNDPYAGAVTGTALSGLTNALILSQGYDKVAPRHNTEENDIKRLMQERAINMDAIRQDLASNREVGLNAAQNVRSNSVRQALEQGVYNNMFDAVSKLGLQEQQTANQYKAEQANMLNSLGSQKAQANLMADDLQARNKGQFLSNVSAFAANLSENGKFITKTKLQDRMNQFMIEVLNKENPNVKLSDDFYKNLKDGKLDKKDWIKMGINEADVDDVVTTFMKFMEEEKKKKANE
jgi:hypothetical protein